MLNNFIGGGQVFLHKVRMFSQVFFRTLHVSLFVGILVSCWLNWSSAQRVDWNGFVSYQKATMALGFDDAFAGIRESIGKDPNHITYINARSGSRVWLCCMNRILNILPHTPKSGFKQYAQI